MPFENNSYGEKLVIREYYYFVLLVDRSQSMLWPFLESESNRNQDNSQDYKNAITKVQHEITVAHEKALSALRSSQICKDRYMKIFQYAFNDRKTLINGPEDLAPVGSDNVVKLTKDNYHPESTTALYDVTQEALQVVEEKLRYVRETEHRIDKLIIGIITDGEDTVYLKRPSEKSQKINEIRQLMQRLRGEDGHSHLHSSVLIGLTSDNFTQQRLLEVKDEISFNDAISINNLEDKAIRTAFKLFSTDAAGR